MATPALVLMHGGAHAADCWDLTVDEIRRCAPDITVVAVDLPGRRGKPGDLASACIEDWATSVVRDIDDAGLDEILIVGHSLAGIIMPAVVTKLGPARVRELVFAAAFLPPDGRSLMDTVPGPLGWYGRRVVHKRAAGQIPRALATYAFCNGRPRSSGGSPRPGGIRRRRPSRWRTSTAVRCPRMCREAGS